MAALLIENKLVAPSSAKSVANVTEKRVASINGQFLNKLVNQQNSYNNTKLPNPSIGDPVSSSEKFKLYAEQTLDYEIKENKKYDFEITHVETLHEFYVKVANQQFRALYNDMQYFYEKKSNLPQPLIKSSNACVYYDNVEKCWQRARISNVVGTDHCLIKLVDRGETRYVNKATLRAIHDKYIDFPCQALRASLSDLEEKHEEEIDESLNVRFREIALNKTLIGKVVAIKVATPDSINSEENAFHSDLRQHMVNLFDEESGESVYSLLVQGMNTTLNSSNVHNKFKPSVKSELEETQMQNSFVDNSNVSILTNGNSLSVSKPALLPTRANVPEYQIVQQHKGIKL
jgi:hypothetical protein